MVRLDAATSYDELDLERCPVCSLLGQSALRRLVLSACLSASQPTTLDSSLRLRVARCLVAFLLGRVAGPSTAIRNAQAADLYLPSKDDPQQMHYRHDEKQRGGDRHIGPISSLISTKQAARITWERFPPTQPPPMQGVGGCPACRRRSELPALQHRADRQRSRSPSSSISSGWSPSNTMPSGNNPAASHGGLVGLAGRTPGSVEPTA